MKESCPGSREIKTPYPEELVCPSCLRRNEIWTDEPDTVCKGCGRVLSRDLKPSCLQWCPAAKDCLGAQKYERLLEKLKEQENRS